MTQKELHIKQKKQIKLHVLFRVEAKFHAKFCFNRENQVPVPVTILQFFSVNYLLFQFKYSYYNYFTQTVQKSSFPFHFQIFVSHHGKRNFVGHNHLKIKTVSTLPDLKAGLQIRRSRSLFPKIQKFFHTFKAGLWIRIFIHFTSKRENCSNKNRKKSRKLLITAVLFNF